MFELKPDYEQVFERFEAWWHGELIDRPLVSLTVPKPPAERVEPPRSRHANLRERWLDVEYNTAAHCARLGSHHHLGEALPIAWPNLGPEVFAAFYGCELDFMEETSYSRPILSDWSEESMAALKLDEDNIYYRKIMEMTDALIECAAGRFIVGYTDLHPGGDALASFRDPQHLLMDTITAPEQIARLNERLTGEFLEVYDGFHAKLAAAGMPSTTWIPAVGKGRFHVPSNDFSCMISSEAFESLFLPGLVRECRHMDRCIYHLDGPQAVRHLELLLEVPEIQAIQYVFGAGNGTWADWIEVYQRIQSRGKALKIVSLPVQDLELLFESLRPEGVWISHVEGVETPEEAAAVLEKLAGWTKRR